MSPGTLLKRIRQSSYVCSHPVSHRRCAQAVHKSGLAPDTRASLKYLGKYLALSLNTRQRRTALMSHYRVARLLLGGTSRKHLNDGVLIWQRNLGENHPPLRIHLEQSKRGRMEGELQLRYSYKSDLFVLTFLFSSADVFGRAVGEVIFIGGVQGRPGTRAEMREAAKLNEEISPASMLVLAVRAMASVMNIPELIAVGGNDQICTGNSTELIRLNYHDFWSQAGGVWDGRHYRIPAESKQKCLSEVARAHRARTRRKRAAKRLLEDSIRNELRLLFRSSPIPVL